MEILLKIIERMDIGTILVIVVSFWFFYQRLETKIDKVEFRLGQRIDKVEECLNQKIDKVEEGLNQKIDKVKEKLRKEMAANTREINSRIDALYNFMFTLCGFKRDVIDRQDENNKAAWYFKLF